MPHRLTATQLLAKLQSRELSAREALTACLRQIKRVDHHLNAFLSYDEQNALAQADAADRLRSQGVPPPPLLGLPVALKDILAVRGQPLHCGSRILEGFVSPYDATVVEKLRHAGAVVFGRLNMDEFAMGSSNENSAFGPTRNPWDTTRVPGGSSGGSAAAVAADLCPVALGSDTGGSVRLPAGFCGCVGLKPTYGRVSRYGLVAFASSLDQVGPLAKDVRDAALILQTIGGHDPRDSTSVPEPVPDYAEALGKSIRGLKLGVAKEYMIGGLDSEVEQAIQKGLQTLRELGAEIMEVSLPHTDYGVDAYYVIATAEASANLARYDGIRYGRRVDATDLVSLYAQTRGAGFGPEVKRRILLGTYVLSSGYYDAYYLRAQKVRTLIRQDFLRAFEQVDALVCPCSPTAAFPIGAKSNDPLQMYLTDIFMLSCNLAGMCGLSLPCGYTRNPKLPIGMQFLGPPFGEPALFRLGHAFQSATSWHQERPALAAVPNTNAPVLN